MAEIDPALLAALLARDEAMVQNALDKVHDGSGAAMPLSFIFVTNPAKPHEVALIDYLRAIASVELFIGALRALGEDIVVPNDHNAQLEAIRDNSVDPAQFAAFLSKSQAFRCRIRVNNTVVGSGVFVSYRLVLTAWHVVNRELPWDIETPPLIEIDTSDGRLLPARQTESFSPCHPVEWQGQIPNDNDLAGHDDFALLRIAQPVGFTLGFVTPVKYSGDWQGNVACFLVHYPLGENTGLAIGEATFGQSARRYRHTAPGAQGSSGGAIFSNRCELIGVHQKLFSDNERRFVPVRNFANDDSAELVQVLRRDQRPTYLWSLDGSLESHLVIGRQKFFDALDYIIDASVAGSDRLRGVWMRRKRADEDQSGMSFGFDLLNAFLARRQPNALAVRVAMLAGETDLFALVEAAFGNLAGSSSARPGVLADETTQVAFDADRASALIRRITEMATGPVWIYFDGPKEDLSNIMVRQLEQLLTQICRAPAIRFVLTRMESYSFPLARFATLGEISDRGPSGVLHEYAGDFSLDDVMTTVRAASADLGIGLDDADIRVLSQQTLFGIDATFGFYPASALKTVADRVLDLLRPRVIAA